MRFKKFILIFIILLTIPLINAQVIPPTKTPPITPNSCTDTDGGIAFDKKGTVSGFNNGKPFSYTDYCMDSFGVMELFCDGTNREYQPFNCERGDKCLDGACTKSCNSNTECPVALQCYWKTMACQSCGEGQCTYSDTLNVGHELCVRKMEIFNHQLCYNGKWTCADVGGLVINGIPTGGRPDGVVNMRDINFMILHFNENPSSPAWLPSADINRDNVVNMRDINIAILEFQKPC